MPKTQTISLDALLHGTPTKEQVQNFFKNGEFCSEEYLVSAIKKHLQTDAHRQQLNARDLSIEDCMNGRFGGDEELTVLNIFHDWNEWLGFKHFVF